MLGAMAAVDARGRLVAWAVTLQMLGLAAGPSIAAALLAGGDGYARVIALGIVLFIASFLLIAWPALRIDRQARGSGGVQS